MKARTPFFIINASVVLFSLLNGLGIVPCSDILGVIFSFYSLFILPGFLISKVFLRREKCRFFSVILYFFVSLVVVAIVVLLGSMPFISFREISIALAGFNIALLLLSARKENAEEEEDYDVRRNWLLASIAAILFLSFFVLFMNSGELGWGSDSLDHLSFVRRSVESGKLFPNDSFYKDGDGTAFDPRKGLWHPILSLWVYQSNVAPDYLWKMLPSFLSFFAVISFIYFASELLGSTMMTAFALALFLIFLNGEGIAWFTKIGFSRNIAQILIWINTAFLLSYYRRGERSPLYGSFFVTAVGTAVHVQYALLQFTILLSFFIYTNLTHSGVRWRKRFWLSVPFQLVASFIPLYVRFLHDGGEPNIIHRHIQGMLFFGRDLVMVDPIEVISRFGLVMFFALLLIPFFFALIKRSPRALLIAVMFIVPVAMVLDPFTATPLEKVIGYLHYRILYAAPLFCFLSLGLLSLVNYIVYGRGILYLEREEGVSILQARSKDIKGEHFDRSFSSVLGSILISLSKRIVPAFLIFLFIFFPLKFALQKDIGMLGGLLKPNQYRNGRYEEFMNFLNEKLQRHSVIVSDPLTSYIISAYTDHFVVVTRDQHGSPLDDKALYRLYQVQRLFDPCIPMSKSLEWLKENDADYIVLNDNLEGRADFFGTVEGGELNLSYEKLKKCSDLIKGDISIDGFHILPLNKQALAGDLSGCDTMLSRPIACGLGEGAKIVTDTTASSDTVAEISIERPLDEGYDKELSVDMGNGLTIRRVTVNRIVFVPGDTVRMSICWSVEGRQDFGLPLELTIRLDGDFPKGQFYRHWYGKQYRRIIERKNGVLYRYTLRRRLMSGPSFPYDWDVGERVREDLVFPLSRWLAPGEYDVRVDLHRLPYLENRRLADFFLNEDSIYGKKVLSVRVKKAR